MNELIERLGWVLVHSLWQLALVALLAGVISRAMRRSSSAARYGVHVVAMGVMVVAPLVTWWVVRDDLVSRVALAPGPDAAQPTSPGTDTLRLTETLVASVDERGVGSTIFRNSPKDDSPTSQTDVGKFRKIVDPTPERESSWSLRAKTALQPWLTWIVVVWCIGVAVCSLRPLLGWHTLWRLKRVGVSPASEEIAAALRRVSERLQLRRAASVLQSTLAQVPVVVGYLRPVVLLPVSLMTSLPAEQLEAILAHELAHVRRHDFVVNLLQTLVETFFFYHPAVWWLSHQIRVEREHCCDDLVVASFGNRVEYGRALLAIEELRGRSSVLALGVADGSLLARIRRIVGIGREPIDASQSWSARMGGGWLGGLVTLVLILGVTCGSFVFSWEKPKELPSSNPFLVKTSDGVEVELLGVSTHWAQADAKREPKVERRGWWQPDGTAMTKPPVSGLSLGVPPAEQAKYFDDWPAIAVRVRSGNADEVDNRVIIIDGMREYVAASTGGQNQERFYREEVLSGGPLPGLKSGIVRVAVGSGNYGPWQTTRPDGTVETDGAIPDALQSSYERLPTIQLREFEGQTRLVSPDQPVNYSATRARGEAELIDVDGKPVQPGAYGVVNGERGTTYPIPLARVSHYRVRLRAYRHWVTFENVSFQPGHKTEVKSSIGKTPELRRDPLMAALPNGVRVEFVGLAAMEAEPKTWWKPDGSPLSDVPKYGSEMVSVTGQEVRRALLRVHGRNLNFEDVTALGLSSVLLAEWPPSILAKTPGSGEPFIRIGGGYAFPPGQKTGRVEVGVATQPQSPARYLNAKGQRVTFIGRTNSFRNSSGTLVIDGIDDLRLLGNNGIQIDIPVLGPKGRPLLVDDPRGSAPATVEIGELQTIADGVAEDIEVISIATPFLKPATVNGRPVMSPEKEADNKVLSQQTQITWRAPNVPKPMNLELVLIDVHGKQHRHVTSGGGLHERQNPDGTPHWGSTQRFFRFDVPLARVAGFEYRVRPYQHWVTFDNVALNPGEITDVKVHVESAPEPRAGRGSPDPALGPTEGLPNSDNGSKESGKTDGDLRSNPAAGSGDPRRAHASKLKVLNSDGSLARFNGIVSASVGFPSEKSRSWDEAPTKEGLISLEKLTPGTHWLVAAGDSEQRTAFQITVPTKQPIVEQRLRNVGTFVGDDLTVSATVAGTSPDNEVISIEIKNESKEPIPFSEEDISLTMHRVLFRVLSPRIRNAAKQPLPQIKVLPGTSQTLTIKWPDWVREGLWQSRMGEAIDEPWSILSEPGKIQVRVNLGNHGTVPGFVTSPQTIIKQPASAGRATADPARDTTEGSPNLDKDSNESGKTDGDLRSNAAAGSGDPRRAQDEAGLKCRLVAVPASVNDESPDLSKSVAAFARGEDVTLAVELQNVSDRTRTLIGVRYDAKGQPQFEGKLAPEIFAPYLFELEFTDAKGQPVPRTSRVFLEMSHRLSGALTHSIDPGKSLVVVLRPSRFLPPMEHRLPPGKYQARVRYHGPSDQDLAFFRSQPANELRANAWYGEVTSNPVTFTVADETVEAKRPKLVWGPVKDGLQAAVEFRPLPGAAPTNDPPGTFPTKPEVSTIFHVKNVSDRTIKFVSETWRQGDEFTVTDEAGESKRLEAGYTTGVPIMVRWTLKPGEIAELHATASIYLLNKPGKYTVRYDINFGNLRGNNGVDQFPKDDDWQQVLPTGDMPITIRARAQNEGVQDKPAQRVSQTLAPIEGQVIDSVTGKPIDGATVRFRFRKMPVAFRANDKPLAELVFRNVGRFTFELPDAVKGETELFVEPFGEHPDYQTWGAVGQGFYLRPNGGPSPSLDLIRQVKLGPGKVVTGQVLDLNGRPAKGIEVTSGFTRAGWQNGFHHNTTTDSNGRYRMVVPAGKGQGRVYVIPNHAAAVSRAITPEFGEQPVFQLLRGTRMLGRVTDAKGRGVEGVVVRAVGSNRVPTRYAMTDADGKYSLPPCQYGQYGVELYDEGRIPELPKDGVRLPDVYLHQLVDLPKTAPTELQLDFKPTESVRMTARYTTSDDQPVSGRSLSVQGVAGKVNWWGRLREVPDQPGLLELRVPRGFEGRIDQNADLGGFLRILREGPDAKPTSPWSSVKFDNDGVSFHVRSMKASSITLRATHDGQPVKIAGSVSTPRFADQNAADEAGARLPSAQFRTHVLGELWFDAHPNIDLLLKLDVPGFKPWQTTLQVAEGENRVIDVALVSDKATDPQARAGRGSPDPALDPTAGLPKSDDGTNPTNNANGDLRSNPAAGSGDPRRAQANAIQGEVLSIDQQRQVAVISIGEKDSVKKLMKFDVRANASANGKAAEPVVKGTVEVIRLEQDTSEVRILKEDAANKIAKGDVVVPAAEKLTSMLAPGSFGGASQLMRIAADGGITYGAGHSICHMTLFDDERLKIAFHNENQIWTDRTLPLVKGGDAQNSPVWSAEIEGHTYHVTAKPMFWPAGFVFRLEKRLNGKLVHGSQQFFAASIKIAKGTLADGSPNWVHLLKQRDLKEWRVDQSGAGVIAGKYTGGKQIMQIANDGTVTYNDQPHVICHLEVHANDRLTATFNDSNGKPREVTLPLVTRADQKRASWSAEVDGHTLRATAVPYSSNVYVFRLEKLLNGKLIEGSQEFYAINQKLRKATPEELGNAGTKPAEDPQAKVEAPADLRLEGDEVSADGIERLVGKHWGTVTLADGRFNGAIIERLRHAGSIRTLRLFGTGLSGQISRLDHVNGLVDLEIGAPLIGHDLEAIGKLTRLERLSLPQELTINVSGAREIAQLTNLKSLRLYNVNIDDSAFVELRPLTRLEELDLTHTRITDEGLTTIEQMPQLKKLELHRHPDWSLKQQLTDACMKSILRLPKLETLSLSGKITDSGLEQLGRLPKLKSLMLMNTEVTGEGLDALKNSPIESMILPGELMGDPTLKHLQKYRALKRLHVIGKSFGQSDMDEWQRQLPKIDWDFSS